MSDIIKNLKIWRMLGKSINIAAVSRLLDGAHGIIGYLATVGSRPLSDEDIPWTPFEKKLPDCRMSVITTAGVYVEGQTPFDIDAVAGDPSFREIPHDINTSQLKIAHTHYPLARALEDINVILPFNPLRYLVSQKIIGALTPRFYSFGFGGFLKNQYIKPGSGTAHLIVEKLREDRADLVMLVPA